MSWWRRKFYEWLAQQPGHGDCCAVEHADLEDEIYNYADRLADDTQPVLYDVDELNRRLNDES